MNANEHAAEPQSINLSKGEQAVVNGALVTATTACTIEVGSGGFVFTGRSLRRSRASVHNPHEELYFSLLDACTSIARFEEERFRLFRLLSKVVAQDRTHEAQKECSLCAAALIAGRIEEATRSASRLASLRLHRNRKTPARPGYAQDLRQEIVQPPINPML